MSDSREVDALDLGSGEPAPRDGRQDDREEPEEMEVEIVSFGDDEPAAAPELTGDGSAAAERELAELRERHLRLRADFENYRKRSEREREERLRRGVADTMRELLPVADNLTRALAAPGGLEDLRVGVEMIGRQLAEVLRREGVEAIDALGKPFDPQLHEAVAREESAEVEAPTVVAEFQRGYLHGDRLLRPAMVRVALPVASGSAAPVTDEGRDESGGEEPS